MSTPDKIDTFMKLKERYDLKMYIFGSLQTVVLFLRIRSICPQKNPYQEGKG